MRLLGTNWLDAFIEKHPTSRGCLRRWQKLIETSHYRNLVELRKTFRSADFVEGKTVFDVGGNKIRTITVIEYGISQVVITHVLTHEEYDRDKWKE